eukprot:749952-Hanusia_phi.AAC.2
MPPAPAPVPGAAPAAGVNQSQAAAAAASQGAANASGAAANSNTNAAQAAHASSQSASQAQGGSSSQSRSSAGSSTPWRADSEETIKTRKNALRVIVTKFRHFWPTESEAKLAYRAGVVENGVYECSSSKTEYITALQKDLNVITQRKELERKALRTQIQTSGDLHAQEEARGNANQSSQSSDVRSKYVQKVYYMEKKHQQLLLLARQQEDRIQNPADSTSMRQVISTFRTLSQAKDRGPYDIDQLNKVDEHLERVRLQSRGTSSGRSLVSKETLEKQNDRTQQPPLPPELVRGPDGILFMLTTMQILLNDETQDSVADEGVQDTQRAPKRRKLLVQEKEKADEQEPCDASLAQILHSGRPLTGSEYSNASVPRGSSRAAKACIICQFGYLMLDSVRDTMFLNPEPLVDVDFDQVDRCYSDCMIRQKVRSHAVSLVVHYPIQDYTRSGDGTSQQHVVVLRILRDIDKKDPLPWDCK